VCAVLFLTVKDIFDLIMAFENSKDTSSPSFNEGVLEHSLVCLFLPQEGGLKKSIM